MLKSQYEGEWTLLLIDATDKSSRAVYQGSCRAIEQVADEYRYYQQPAGCPYFGGLLTWQPLDEDSATLCADTVGGEYRIVPLSDGRYLLLLLRHDWDAGVEVLDIGTMQELQATATVRRCGMHPLRIYVEDGWTAPLHGLGVAAHVVGYCELQRGLRLLLNHLEGDQFGFFRECDGKVSLLGIYTLAQLQRGCVLERNAPHQHTPHLTVVATPAEPERQPEPANDDGKQPPTPPPSDARAPEPDDLADLAYDQPPAVQAAPSSRKLPPGLRHCSPVASTTYVYPPGRSARASQRSACTFNAASGRSRGRSTTSLHAHRYSSGSVVAGISSERPRGQSPRNGRDLAKRSRPTRSHTDRITRLQRRNRSQLGRITRLQRLNRSQLGRITMTRRDLGHRPNRSRRTDLTPRSPTQPNLTTRRNNATRRLTTRRSRHCPTGYDRLTGYAPPTGNNITRRRPIYDRRPNGNNITRHHRPTYDRPTAHSLTPKPRQICSLWIRGHPHTPKPHRPTCTRRASHRRHHQMRRVNPQRIPTKSRHPICNHPSRHGAASRPCLICVRSGERGGELVVEQLPPLATSS